MSYGLQWCSGMVVSLGGKGGCARGVLGGGFFELGVVGDVLEAWWSLSWGVFKEKWQRWFAR